MKTKFFRTICPWGLNKLGTVYPEGPINWEPIVRGEMSRDHMCLGPNVSQPFMFVLRKFVKTCHELDLKHKLCLQFLLKQSLWVGIFQGYQLTFLKSFPNQAHFSERVI